MMHMHGNGRPSPLEGLKELLMGGDGDENKPKKFIRNLLPAEVEIRKQIEEKKQQAEQIMIDAKILALQAEKIGIDMWREIQKTLPQASYILIDEKVYQYLNEDDTDNAEFIDQSRPDPAEIEIDGPHSAA